MQVIQGALFAATLGLMLAFPAIAAKAGPVETSAGEVAITKVASGLEEPWGLAFLPEGGFLVTERAGALRHYRADGSFITVAGLPEVFAQGQGGLLDVMLPRDFPQSREAFLTFAKPQGQGAGTALAVARLSEAGDRLEGLRLIYEVAEGASGGQHFGARVVEAADGTLYLTLGERGDGRNAQNLGRAEGKVLRLNRDGSIPADNPFATRPGVLPEIWSYGHRNPQGAALDGTGRLWINEHGAMGGDEINQPEAGRNYGWPVIAYGRHYNGSRIGVGPKGPNMEQPAHYWDPSIAPSGMMIYSGALWPEWAGHHFVGSLKFDRIVRLDPEAGFALENISAPETQRVRDVREAPDGSIWFLSVGQGAVYRIGR